MTPELTYLRNKALNGHTGRQLPDTLKTAELNAMSEYIAAVIREYGLSKIEGWATASDNKTLCILPFAVGTRFWSIDVLRSGICEVEVTAFYLDPKYPVWSFMASAVGEACACEYIMSDIGKVIFFNKEDAEQAFKPIPVDDDYVLTTREDFQSLRDILHTHDIYYGSCNTMMTGHGTIQNYGGEGEDYELYYDIMINFNRPDDKQLFLSIIIDGSSNHDPSVVKNYFFTWYDHRAYEVSTMNGRSITKKMLDQLTTFLLESGLQSSPSGMSNVIVANDSCEAYSYRKKA